MNGFARRYLHRANRGFTLIEVMIVVAIVAILAAVALPSYTDYVRRGQLPDAFTLLSQDKIKLEQYYQDDRNYGATSCGEGMNLGSTTYFTATCQVRASGQGFLLQADGNAGTRAAGHTYTLDDGNLKGTIAFKGAAYAAGAKQCWLVSSASEC